VQYVFDMAGWAMITHDVVVLCCAADLGWTWPWPWHCVQIWADNDHAVVKGQRCRCFCRQHVCS